MIKKLLLISVVVGCLSVFLCIPAFATVTEQSGDGYALYNGVMVLASEVPAGEESISLDGMNVIIWDGDTTDLPSSGSWYLLTEYEYATDGVAVFVNGEELDVGTVFETTDSGWTISYATATSSYSLVAQSIDGVGIGGAYYAEDGYTSLIAYTPYETPPEEGGGADTLENLTVFFYSSELDYEKGMVSWSIENLNPDLQYDVQVRLFESGVAEYISINYFTVTGTESYSNAIFYDGLASEQTYRGLLTIWLDNDFVTYETTFTTDAASSGDDSGGSGDSGSDDSGSDDSGTDDDKVFEEWNDVTEIPPSVTDKVEQGNDILEEFDSLEKPDPDELVPELDADISPVMSLFEKIFAYSLVVDMLTMAAGFALVSWVLFGKRG